MTTSTVLAAALDKQELRVRRAYSRLTDEEKQYLEDAFRRHAVACQRSGIPIEHAFIREAIDDAMFEHSSYRMEHPEPISNNEYRITNEEDSELFAAVGELVNTAFHLHGGVGPTGARVLRNRFRK